VDDKTSTMHMILQEKYGVIRAIRQRVQGISLATIGGLAAAAAWCASQNPSFGSGKRGVISALLILTGFAVWRFLVDLNRGFKATWKVITDIETSLGCYTEEHFGIGTGTIYPKKWQEGGRAGGDGRFFFWSYLFITLAVVAATSLVWL